MNTKSTFRLIVEPIAIAVALAMVVRSACRIYAIPSRSMAPTLEAGDHIVVTPYRFFHDGPQRGDVVVFRSPLDPNELLVKRVVALPGDFVESAGGRVRIDGRTLAEPYVAVAAASGEIPAQLIPRESLFVMGDNRGDSFDSRSWGPLRRDLVVGRARLILWSSAIDASAPSAHARSVSHGPLPRVDAIRLDRLFKVIH